MPATTRPNPDEDKLREHEYDGIQEFDKRLPNWWLFTLYGTIIFSFCSWLFNHWLDTKDPQFARLERDLARVAAAKAAQSDAQLSDDDLWAMSGDPQVKKAGAAIYTTNCAPCHGDKLEGKIGPSLADNVWIHGNTPQAVLKTLVAGVPEKGMPTWGPVLGNKRINEVAAYVLSHHQKPQ